MEVRYPKITLLASSRVVPTVKAHGPRNMPVCGKRSYAEDGGKRRVKERIAKMVAYLQSIPNAIRRASHK